MSEAMVVLKVHIQSENMDALIQELVRAVKAASVREVLDVQVGATPLANA